MNEISCDVCMDLMPLVHDGVASADSREAVARHIQNCPSCKALFEGELPTPTEHGKLLEKLQQKMRIFSAMVLMFGVFFGLMLTAGSGLFYNAVIMPIIGAIGYYLFRWKAVYAVPILLLITHLFTNALGLGAEYLEFPALLLWTALYCIFAFVGTAIAALLHFALKKEDT